MREISSEKIKVVVKDLCIKSNYFLPNDVKQSLDLACQNESSSIGKNILNCIVENYKIAETGFAPICQDTGAANVFLEIGQDVQIIGDLEEAINEGVREGYKEGHLRHSIVKDPLDRVNTNDNTPAFIYYELVKGDKIKVTVCPKGFGSENMSRIIMLKPSDGVEGVKNFVLDTVELAGANPCPPIILGVGIGGTFDKCAFISKKALLRDISIRNENKFYADLESELLELINKKGIGPSGLGGYTTALAVNIEYLPTHIAGLPVAVNVSCHATRHMSEVI